MHAGEASKRQRPAGIRCQILAASGETTMPAGIQTKMHAGMANNGSDQRAHGATLPPAARQPYRRGYKTKNARRQGEEWQRPAGTRCQFPPPAARRPCRRGYKTKCTPVRQEQRQRPAAHGAKFSAASAKTIMPAGIQNEKCTPAWRTTAATSGHTVPNSPPPAPKRSCRRGY
ncbi:MAG: hypothetical protein ACLTDS_02415 [Bianqueaceae bacterium]